MKPLILIGSGGHALACLDVIVDSGLFEVLGYVDNDPSKGSWEGLKFLGTDSELPQILKTCPNVFLGPGQINTPDVRKKLVTNLIASGATFPNVISKRAYVANSVRIGEGNIVMHGSQIGPGVKIGNFNIFNSKSLIEHGVQVGDFNHISTAAVVNGDVLIKNESFVGSNSVLCQGIHLPEKAFIQAGTFIGRKHDWR